MMTFEQLMELTRTVNCEGVYSTEALRGLYNGVSNCPEVGNFVEIGCEYGRSTSLIAQIAKERGQYLVCIDPFVRHLSGSPGAGVAEHTIGMLVKLDVKFAFFRGYSFEVPYRQGPIAFLHIDGNHSAPFLLADMERFLPMVVDGGYVCFHDYGNPGAYSKDVQAVIDRFMPPWERIGEYDTCVVFRRRGPYENYYAPDGGRP